MPTDLHLLGQGAALDYDYRYESETSATIDPRVIGVKDDNLPRNATLLTSLYGEEYDEGDSIDGDEEKNWEGVSEDGVDLYTIPGSPKKMSSSEHMGRQPQSDVSEETLNDDHFQDELDLNTELEGLLVQEIAKLSLETSVVPEDIGICVQSQKEPGIEGDTRGFLKPSVLLAHLLKTDYVLPSDTEDSNDPETPEFMDQKTDYSVPHTAERLKPDTGMTGKTSDSFITRFTTSDDEITMDFDDNVDFFKPLETLQDQLIDSEGNLQPESPQNDSTDSLKFNLGSMQERLAASATSTLDNDFSQMLWAQSGWSTPPDGKDHSPDHDISSAETKVHIKGLASLKLRLVTCGSSVENPPALHNTKENGHSDCGLREPLEKVLHQDNACDAPPGFNKSEYPLETEEEYKLRRLKEKTIDHNGFSSLEEFTLCDVFLLPEEVMVEKRSEGLLKPMTKPLPLLILAPPPSMVVAPVKKVFTLYSKDNVSARLNNDKLQVKISESNDEDSMEDWIQSITRGLEVDFGDLATGNHMSYIDGASLFLEFVTSASEEEGGDEDNLNYEQYLSDTKTRDSNLASTALSDLADSAKNLQTIASANMCIQEGSSGACPFIRDNRSSNSLSPAGTVTALLVSHCLNDSAPRPKNGPHFQERYRSVSETADPTSNSTWTLNNRFVSLPLPPQPKRRKSIRRIFFPKSSGLPEAQHEQRNDELKGQVQTNKPTKDDTSSIRHSTADTDIKGSLKLKTNIWRSKTFSRKSSTAHSFNLESGVSLNEAAAEYSLKTDLSFPADGEIISNGTESMRRMLSSQVPLFRNQNADITLNSSDSLDTLPSLFDEKFGTRHKSVSEHIPTPAPFPSVVQDVHDPVERKTHFLGMRRSKSVSSRRNTTIRFAASPVYIVNESSENDKNVDDKPVVEKTVSEVGELAPTLDDGHKSILKRSHTLRGHGKTRSIFRSIFGYSH